MPALAPLVSVIIPAYNVAPFIGDAVESALRQTYSRFEVIVVNDGSTDETAARLQAVTDARVTVIHKANGGISSARNAGIRAARGQYLAFLDGDDLWHPSLLQSLVAYLEHNTGVDLAHAFAHIVTEDGRDTGRVMRCRPGPVTLRELLVRNVIMGSAVVCRASAMAQAGEFDETLETTEDQDQWIRIAALRSGNIHAVGEILASYRRRRGQMTKDWSRMQNGWEKMLNRAAGRAPEAVQLARREASAHYYRYLGYIALDAGDYVHARRFLVTSLRNLCPSLLLDRPTWFLIAAVGSATLFPPFLHRALLGLYRRKQSALGAGAPP